MRKIFPLFILILFFLNFFFTQPSSVIAVIEKPTYSKDAIGSSEFILKCGSANERCCDGKFEQSTNEKDYQFGSYNTYDVDSKLKDVRADAKGITNDAGLKAKQLLSDLIKNMPLCREGRPEYTADTVPICFCKLSRIQDFCLKIESVTEQNKCKECNTRGVWTALGCFDYELPKFIQNQVFGLGFGLAGITAFFCILYAAFLMQMSQGNPERVKKAQELLVACISGLILIIFSIFILKLIGVDILRIPGFTK